MLKIRNVSKSYVTNKKAVDNLSLEINPGEIFGFIGHNGAGKTTTIKAIVGLIDFEEGEIFVNDKNIKDYPLEVKSIIAYLPDNPDLYAQLTGMQFLNFVFDIYKINKETRDLKVTEYADMFEISNNLNELISTYSHGMKQKLALISALVRKPKLLVLDEPFVGLDPKASFLVKKVMRELCDSGSSIFFSTHILEVAEKLCDHVGIIKNGKLIAYGTMDQVKGDKSLEDVFLESVDA